MSGPPPIRFVIWNDGGEGLSSSVDDDQQKGILQSYATLVSESIDAVLGLRQFRHVEAVEAGDAAENVVSSIAVGFDDGDSDTVDLDKMRGRVNISGLLLGCSKLPEDLTDAVELVTDEETGAVSLQWTDETLAKQVSAILKRVRLDKRYDDWISGSEEEVGAALDAASESVEVTESPMDPFDVLQLLVGQLIRVAGVSPPPPSLLGRGVQLVGRLVSSPRAALRQVTKRLGRAQRLWWQLEDVVIDGSKLAARVALKAARPVLVGLVLHRVLRTLDRSRSLEVRMSRAATPEEAVELYYRTVLGPDWREQFQQDMDKAVQDVQDGLVTDDINQEKRRMTAAQLRRLEVEEWDKQRMKNFYLASFGGMRWFEQMEAALHNPLFIESRGWTDPVQNWVGENRTYMGDLAGGQYGSDVGQLALRLKEKELGRRLSDRERAAVLSLGAELAGGVGLGGEDKSAQLAAAALEAGSMLSAPRSAKS